MQVDNHRRSFVEVGMCKKVVVVVSGTATNKADLIQTLIESYVGGVNWRSVTTRPPCSWEVHGREFFFVSESEFNTLIIQGAFVEYELHEGYWYGIPWINKGELGTLELLDLIKNSLCVFISASASLCARIFENKQIARDVQKITVDEQSDPMQIWELIQ